MSEYPEHDKLRAIKAQSQVCGSFLDWVVSESGCYLGKLDQRGNELHPPTIESLLADYFGIDRDRIEQEKQTMIEHLRRGNG